MVRIRITRYGVTEQIPGAREKGGCSPYQELTQVPLAEKAKACRNIIVLRELGKLAL